MEAPTPTGQPPTAAYLDHAAGREAGATSTPSTPASPRTRCFDQTPRQEAQRLEAAIKEHAYNAAELAERAQALAETGRDCSSTAFSQAAQANAAAAQALALLRGPRQATRETR